MTTSRLQIDIKANGMALVDNMIALKARLQGIPIRFAVPQYQPLLVRHLSTDPINPATTHIDTLINPAPFINGVNPRNVDYSIGENIEVRADDFQVKEVTRQYTREFLTENVEFYAIAPTLQDGAVVYDDCKMPVSAIICKCLHVSDRDLLSWRLILRKLTDGYNSGPDRGLF